MLSLAPFRLWGDDVKMICVLSGPFSPALAMALNIKFCTQGSDGDVGRWFFELTYVVLKGKLKSLRYQWGLLILLHASFSSCWGQLARCLETALC